MYWPTPRRHVCSNPWLLMKLLRLRKMLFPQYNKLQTIWNFVQVILMVAKCSLKFLLLKIWLFLEWQQRNFSGWRRCRDWRCTRTQILYGKLRRWCQAQGCFRWRQWVRSWWVTDNQHCANALNIFAWNDSCGHFN